MANTKSAKKAVRVSERRTAINKNRRSRVRTFIRRVEEAIASGDKSAAETALRDAQPEIMRGAQKGIVHKNTASRKISRLSARIRAHLGLADRGFRELANHLLHSCHAQHKLGVFSFSGCGLDSVLNQGIKSLVTFSNLRLR